MKIQRSSYGLNFNGETQEILGTLEFDEIYPTCFLLHLVARKNKFPAKVDLNLNFL
jgi:hypothetical protein